MLAPMLWEQLEAEERARLTTAHRQRYYELAINLDSEDTKNPHAARAIAWRELRNLLDAVGAAFDAHDSDAVRFADRVTNFLIDFGQMREAERLGIRARAAAGGECSQAWYLAQSNHGEQLRAAGRVGEALRVFQAILARLGEAPTYERVITLTHVGRCYEYGGQVDLAVANQKEALRVVKNLQQSDSVKQLEGAIHTDLADSLRDLGRYSEARKEYEAGFRIEEELEDLRGQGVTLGQLGTLAMLEGKLGEAQRRHNAALALFQLLREPAMEAVAWHLLGEVFRRAGRWDEAERHFRESARITEGLGDIASAAGTWNNLAFVTQNAGKPEAAESWYRKAIDGGRAQGDLLSVSYALNNLADLLQAQPARLAEARQLAEEALALKKASDPGAVAIWNTCELLAQIADKEESFEVDSRRLAELRAEARENRRLARDAKRAFAGTREELKKYLLLILSSFRAVRDPARRENVDAILTRPHAPRWNNLFAAVHSILAGERDAETLVADLDPDSSMIIETILAAVADPSTLNDLLPPEQADAGTPGDSSPTPTS
jgi:tetratricopeptide (TPR) repeat protein